MKTEWLHGAVLRAASLLAPGDQRAEWLTGWRSELWYVPPRGATLFCLGAFQDALWLRRNSPGRAPQAGIHLESPRSCLLFLALLAVVSLLIAKRLPPPESLPRSSQMRWRALLDGYCGMLLLSSLALPAIRLAMGPDANRHTEPWRDRLRRGLFLWLKIALLQPVIFCGFLLVCRIPVTNFVFNVSYILAYRWVLMDQRRRCPVCLRLLTEPVRIGSASQTFLEWYGAESTCSRGHGLLHQPEMPSSYSRKPQWHALDESWSGLFPETTSARQR